jgi:MFS family permease
MLSRAAKTVMVATAFAPILLTLAFVNWWTGQPPIFWLGYGIAALLLALVCVLILKESARRLERVSVPIESVKPADKEVLAFVLSYLLPLANVSTVNKIDPAILIFIVLLLLLVVFTTNSYHFNPLLGLFGYRFYEVTTKKKVGFVLVTRRIVRDTSAIGALVQLTDYIVLEPDE